MGAKFDIVQSIEQDTAASKVHSWRSARIVAAQLSSSRSSFLLIIAAYRCPVQLEITPTSLSFSPLPLHGRSFTDLFNLPVLGKKHRATAYDLRGKRTAADLKQETPFAGASYFCNMRCAVFVRSEKSGRPQRSSVSSTQDVIKPVSWDRT